MILLLFLLKFQQTSLWRVEICKKNQLIEFREKPIYKHEVNTGVYLVNSKVFDLIPKNKFFDMNSLINKAFKFGKKITLYKVNKKVWKDFGSFS